MKGVAFIKNKTKFNIEQGKKNDISPYITNAAANQNPQKNKQYGKMVQKMNVDAAREYSIENKL